MGAWLNGRLIIVLLIITSFIISVLSRCWDVYHGSQRNEGGQCRGWRGNRRVARHVRVESCGIAFGQVGNRIVHGSVLVFVNGVWVGGNRRNVLQKCQSSNSHQCVEARASMAGSSLEWPCGHARQQYKVALAFARRKQVRASTQKKNSARQHAQTLREWSGRTTSIRKWRSAPQAASCWEK